MIRRFWGPKQTDRAANSDGNPRFYKVVAGFGVILGSVGGWFAPNISEPGWEDGRGDLWALVAVFATVAGVWLSAWFTQRAETGKYARERMENAVDGFKEAAIHLKDYSSEDADVKQSQEIRSKLAKVLGSAVSYGNRQARIVVYLLERTESEDDASSPEVPGGGSSPGKRFFIQDCFGGRPDPPVSSRYAYDTEYGEFFCDQMIRGEQVIIKNVNFPPPEAPLSVSESARYGSFILTPVKDVSGVVRGAVSIDYPGKSRFDSFDCSVAWRIALLFQDTFAATIRSANVSQFEVDEAFSRIRLDDEKGTDR